MKTTLEVSSPLFFFSPFFFLDPTFLYFLSSLYCWTNSPCPQGEEGWQKFGDRIFFNVTSPVKAIYDFLTMISSLLYMLYITRSITGIHILFRTLCSTNKTFNKNNSLKCYTWPFNELSFLNWKKKKLTMVECRWVIFRQCILGKGSLACTKTTLSEMINRPD